MLPTEFKIKRIDDRSLYEIFQKAKTAGDKAISNQSELSALNPQVDFTYSSSLPWVVSDDDLADAPAGQFVLTTASIDFRVENQQRANQRRVESVSFRFQRGGNDSLVDTFTLTPGNNLAAMNGNAAQSVLRAIHKAISPVLQPVAPEDGGLVPTLSNLAEAFGTTYQRITDELSNAVETVNQERANQLKAFRDERKSLQEEAAEERKSLQERAKTVLEEEKRELESQRQSLKEEWQKLETSSHKDARRKQFLQLQEDLGNALAEPVADAGLRQIRWAVFTALVFAGIAAAVFAYASISSGSSNGAAETGGSLIFLAIRSVVLSFVSLASFFGAAAWLRYFYVRDLQAQEELRRFRNDMARASWVMDAALEIRKEHDEDIPPEWIKGVTEGLFAARKKDTLNEGAQALAALMGLSVSTSVGPAGTTVELNKKGGKTIAAAMKDDLGE